VDAHSMLFARAGNGSTAVRFAATDSVESYVTCAILRPTSISQQGALEETFFLGLRLNRGLDLNRIIGEFGEEPVAALSSTLAELVDSGLLERQGNTIRLTPRGRLLSNEVFERFITVVA